MSVITKEKIYGPLTEETAIQLAKNLNLFTDEDRLSCKEIGDGNLNLVFHVTNQVSNNGIIIKQALPYAKVVGESWPLTLHRATIEANALKTHGQFVPHLVPKVFYTDETLAITVMEDLSHLTIARTGFINGEKYPLISEHIGEFLAHTLFLTSDFAVHPAKKKDLVKQFSNPELCKITEELVFTDPFFDYETNEYEEGLTEEVHKIWNDSQLKLEVAKLKKQFLTEAEGLLHGDLHTGSIFASETETKVIDPEFAFYGPFGFDIGQFFANLIFQVIVREKGQKEILFHHLEKTWTTFEAHFQNLWANKGQEVYTKTQGYLEFVLDKTFHDAVGFAGCELIRRTIGLAHVADLDSIENETKRLQVKIKTLQLGKLCVIDRQNVSSIQDYIELIKKDILD